MEDTGTRIRVLRRAKGWTLEEMASKVGVHLSHIQKIELGERVGSLAVLNKIAAALEVSLGTLLGLDQISSELGELLKAEGLTLLPLLSAPPEGSDIEGGALVRDMVLGFVDRPKDLKDKQAFALLVGDNSMKPRFRKGDILIISPNTKLKDKIAVVYRLKDGSSGIGIARWGEPYDIILCTADMETVVVLHLKDFDYVFPVVMSIKKEY